ncbi:hypothetical protein KHU12_26230, partial [Pseudocitrobacter faecalis]|uniref:hypothetical protein n=1 Tax=Pseudocitrobacter faecalis TaxID=1398493 RepID=UPI0033147598
GSVSGAAPGDSVQVIVAGKTHNTTVEANGLWSVTVESTDVAGDDVINSIEQGHALAVTGTSSGLAENAIVTLSDGQGESWT